jgi:amino acid adenylation domain-containing protein
LPAITPVDRSNPLELSFNQQRLWFLAQRLAQKDGVHQSYHIPLSFQFSGELDREALTACLNRIVARHEALRTAFRQHDGQAVQIISPADVGLALPMLDLSGMADPQKKQRQLHQALQQEAEVPFDFDRGPPIRARLLCLTPQEHVLSIVMHHIIFDGWSMAVLMNELNVLYRAYRQAGSDYGNDPLPPLPIQYPDYAHWQRRWLNGERQQRQAQYWQQTLAGIPALIGLPTDRPRPAQQSYAGACYEVGFDADLSARLKAFSQRHGVTLYMTLITSWAILLSRLSGQHDIVIGSPIAGRNRSETENLIGFFVNSLALRFELSPQQTVATLLAQSKQRILNAQQNQDLPFEQIVDLMQPPRSMAHTPLFQVMFAWQNTPQGALELPGLAWSLLELQDSATAKFDLALTLQEQEGGIAGVLEYATALYDRATIARHVEHWRTLLEGMLADDQQSLFSLPLLTPTQRQQVLVDWNRTAAGHPQNRCIQQLFEEQVERTPEAIAVVFQEQQLTYAQLNAQANQLAHHLRELGVRPDTRVAICVERGLEMMIALMAALKAGGAYVPLDPAYPVERLAYMLRDSEPMVLLTQSALLRRLPTTQSQVLLLDGQDQSSPYAHQPTHNIDGSALGLSSHHLAYIIYTSGSTGQPKGVMVEHRNIVRLLQATDARFHFGKQDIWSLFHSFAFDFSVWEIWGALAYGGRLVVIPLSTARSPDQFYRTLCNTGVTVLNQTPSAFRSLIAAQADSRQEHQLRCVILGGEALEPSMLKPWFERNDAVRTQLVNMYGITETTVHATYHALSAADTGYYGASSIGSRLPDLKLYLLDERCEPVPIGVSGEIYIGGAGVTRGYLNRAELTAERFPHDPHSDEAEARMYKSGDLARYLADGSIEYLGRNDNQVTIRGFRIELGEIEAKLATIDGMREAVVLAREDQAGDKRLVAYVVTQKDYTLDAATLREALARELADYMLPSAFVTLAALPLTTNGKLDRDALPKPADDAYVNRGYEAPKGKIEEALAEIWSALLQRELIGRHDNFFEAGGHSLLAVQMLSRVNNDLNVDLALAEIFSHPILSNFAWVIAGASRRNRHPCLTVFRESGRSAPLFIVHHISGSCAYASDLMPWIDADIPIYGLSAPGFRDGETPLDSASDMATLYVEAMQSVRTHGPYRIAGWSAGGIIAYEIARQLLAKHETVDLVALIDTFKDGDRLSDRLNQWARSGQSQPSNTELAYLLMKLKEGNCPDDELSALSKLDSVDAVLAETGAPIDMPSGVRMDILKRHLAVQSGIARALIGYKPENLPIVVELFAASDSLRINPTLGWGEMLTDQFRVHSLEANHSTIMQLPRVADLGIALSKATNSMPCPSTSGEHLPNL